MQHRPTQYRPTRAAGSSPRDSRDGNSRPFAAPPVADTGWIRWLFLTYLVAFTWALASPSAGNPVDSRDAHPMHSRMGQHGMVLFTDGAHLYASHLPLYQRPHDAQIIYRIHSEHQRVLIQQLTAHTAQHNSGRAPTLLTLLPDRFNLDRLIAGETFHLPAQIYSGHFERGGTLWLTEQRLHFVQQIYLRSLSKPVQPLSQLVRWDALSLARGHSTLFVHRIQSPPSFDAILLNRSCPKTLGDDQRPLPAVPTQAHLAKLFEACESSQLIYMEAQDFAL